MKLVIRFSLILAAFTLFFTSINAQTFDQEWRCAYATYDDNANGTGNRTIDVAALSNNRFVALVNRSSSDAYYLIGYKDATAGTGRLGDTGGQTEWVFGFDQVFVYDANALAVGPDDVIYVASNDDGRNILTFKLGESGIESYNYRLPTVGDYLWSVAVDSNGVVYVSEYDTTTTYSKIHVYDNFSNEGAWTDPQFTTPTLLTSIELPDTGEARGLTTTSDGSTIFVSVYQSGKILKYDGSPQEGYTLDENFDYFRIDEVSDTATYDDTITAAPWGIRYMDGNNILVAAHDCDFETGLGYQYGKLIFINPYTAETMHELDVAMHDYIACDSTYNSRPGGTSPDTAASYVSVYNVDYDEEGNLYSQSYFGWAMQKWYYDGTLPVVTSLREEPGITPDAFTLAQNYPNPFNPETTIKFTIPANQVVKLSIYSITGELVGNLINREMNSGTYTLTFDASNLASGIYIYNLTAGNNSVSRKMTLLK